MGTGGLFKKSNVIMFAGKGGVGKTTCAAATALNYAERGEKTGIISTDPTASLQHILERELVEKPTRISENLDFDELGLTEVKEMWEKKFGRELYQVFSAFVKVSYGEFTGHVITMLPALREEFMVYYIMQLSQSGRYERLIWDSAPAGQTMALLKTPSMYINHLHPSVKIYSMLKASRGTKESILTMIKVWQKIAEECLDFLRNEVQFTMVTIPEALAVEQLEGIFGECTKDGLRFSQLVINNVIGEAESRIFPIRAEQQSGYIRALYDTYGKKMRLQEIPRFPYEIKGLGRLREIGECLA
jgi:arsenite-transporting ATPase